MQEKLKAIQSVSRSLLLSEVNRAEAPVGEYI